MWQPSDGVKLLIRGVEVRDSGTRDKGNQRIEPEAVGFRGQMSQCHWTEAVGAVIGSQS